MKAWHWLKDDMRAGSGRERAWKEGEKRTHRAKTLVICARGYHSSPTPWDGLSYAQGNVLCLVEISEPVGQQPDKYVSRTRKLVKAINVERELREFACDVAEEALTREREAGREPDARSWNAIAVARRFNAGETTKEELDAARSAAWKAAWSATRSAARDAAMDAARSAAWDAAMDAAWSATRSAARDAAGDAAWSAAKDALKARFNARLEALFAEVVT